MQTLQHARNHKQSDPEPSLSVLRIYPLLSGGSLNSLLRLRELVDDEPTIETNRDARHLPEMMGE